MTSTRTAQCRHGIFTYHSEDRFLGTSLRIYGEWSEGEVDVYDALLKPTDIAVEVGANIGALTIPMARRCRKVYAFEPHPENYSLLVNNVNANGVTNVKTYPLALGANNSSVKMATLAEIDREHGIIGDYGGFEVGKGSITVEQQKLDDIILSGRVAFMKMDCEGSERNVLIGAHKIIARDKPVIYTENDKPDKIEALIEWLVEHGYECFWHRPSLWRPDNFRNYLDNIFGDCDSKNMLCYPKDYKGPRAFWITEPVIG
jgi:FkbM family methyltransferase